MRIYIVAGLVLLAGVAGCGTGDSGKSGGGRREIEQNYSGEKCYSGSECRSGKCEVDLVGQLSVSVWDDFFTGQGGVSYRFNTADWKRWLVYFDRSFSGISGTVRLKGELERVSINVGERGSVEYLDCEFPDCLDLWDEDISGTCR